MLGNIAADLPFSHRIHTRTLRAHFPLDLGYITTYVGVLGKLKEDNWRWQSSIKLYSGAWGSIVVKAPRY